LIFERFVSRFCDEPICQSLFSLSLYNIDIDLFSQWLKENMNVQKKYTLYDIKNEINNPFAECRELYKDLDEDTLFDLFTGEGEEGLQRGQIVNVRIVSVRMLYSSAYNFSLFHSFEFLSFIGLHTRISTRTHTHNLFFFVRLSFCVVCGL
jgi:hypothetical protein